MDKRHFEVSVAEFITVRFQHNNMPPYLVVNIVSVAEFITVRFQPKESTFMLRCKQVSVAEFITVRFQRVRFARARAISFSS